MNALHWVRNNVEALRVAHSVVVLNPNDVTVYGASGDLAMLRMTLEARPVSTGTRVRSWVAEVDGLMVNLCEVGHAAVAS